VLEGLLEPLRVGVGKNGEEDRKDTWEAKMSMIQEGKGETGKRRNRKMETRRKRKRENENAPAPIRAQTQKNARPPCVAGE
jgi:hypothetical protein